jgi:endonuclease G
MTNNHVISSVADAEKTVIEFDYQLDFYRTLKTTRYRLDPTKFITSIDLDYTIVGVKKSSKDFSCDTWGYLELNHNADPLPGEYVNIIQHPNGGTKQIVLTANEVTEVISNKHVRYTTDTMPGSSGSPVFNDLWQVIAIHHSGGSTDQKYYWNEGVLMSAIEEDAKEYFPLI